MLDTPGLPWELDEGRKARVFSTSFRIIFSPESLRVNSVITNCFWKGLKRPFPIQLFTLAGS